MNQTLDFYKTYGPMTNPGPYAGLLDGLPEGVGALCQVVQGLMVHIFWAEQYGLQLDPVRKGEVQLRDVPRKLARVMELDPRPLTEARPPELRLVGNCRDFSVLMAGFLRHKGIPARARCGFGRYFLPGHYEDHWVCEYWNTGEQRWVLVDAQLDALQRRKLSLSFDSLDVPRDQFITGGAAWLLCRGGAADPDAFGIFDMKGLWFVRGDLVRDVASLNKEELLPWDNWGLMERRDEDLLPEDLDLLDRVAVLTQSDVPDFAKVRQMYLVDDRLRVPQQIRSYTEAGPQEVDLEEYGVFV